MDNNIFMVGKRLPEVDQIEKVDFIESIIQDHMDRDFIEDPIERTLVWSEPIDQLEFECIGFEDLSIPRGGRDSIMNVGH